MAKAREEEEKRDNLQGKIMPDKDGKGPRKGSWMWLMGRRGKKAGHRRGGCK